MSVWGTENLGSGSLGCHRAGGSGFAAWGKELGILQMGKEGNLV